MGKFSRDKGIRFEREVAKIFREHGFENAHRSAQHCGNTGQAADVIGVPGIHIEAKHVEKMRLYDWYEQARWDAMASESKDLPVVIHKQNNMPVLVTMQIDDWMRLYSEWVPVETPPA